MIRNLGFKSFTHSHPYRRLEYHNRIFTLLYIYICVCINPLGYIHAKGLHQSIYPFPYLIWIGTHQPVHLSSFLHQQKCGHGLYFHFDRNRLNQTRENKKNYVHITINKLASNLLLIHKGISINPSPHPLPPFGCVQARNFLRRSSPQQRFPVTFP